MLKFSLLLLGCSFLGTACAQMRVVSHLPPELEENSGIIATGTNRLWLHNDGGNPPLLYLLDTTGQIQRRFYIQNAQNKDWEDIAYDRQRGHFYLGDFGNNDNNRRDLHILKIANPEQSASDTIPAEIIRFRYPQQTAFPPDRSELQYDAEAFMYYEDYLYIFTKCRTKPYSSITRLYQVPCTAGEHEAVLLDSFDTRQASWYSSVTGADCSPDGSKVALVSGGKIWIFSQFEGNQFFKGQVKALSTPGFTQKEAIAFINETDLYVSDERSILGQARLYRLSLPQSKTESSTPFRRVNIDPMPIRKEFSLSFNLLEAGTVAIALYDEDRQFIRDIETSDMSTGKQSLSYSIKEWDLERHTSYYIVLKMNGKEEWHPVVVR